MDMVNHPPHYSGHPSGIECIAVTRDMTFDSGNAFKYVYRAFDKGNAEEDLNKARWYLRDALAHNDGIIFAQSVIKWRKLLDTIIDAEPDEMRAHFYSAVKLRRLDTALRVVDDMLKEFEPLPYSPGDYSADLYYGIEG